MPAAALAGCVDAPIEALIDKLNAQRRFFTTSSCSGRSSLFVEPQAADRKANRKGGEWVLSSHDPLEAGQMLKAVHVRQPVFCAR